MSKSVLVLSSSPRKGGNSDLLCDQFMKGKKAMSESFELGKAV
jgi:multimeric flavodoxin WrbA